MTTTCFVDAAEPSDAATPIRQWRRMSNRIKLSRELMIRLTAALNNGGGGGASCTGLVRDGQAGDGASVVDTSLTPHDANEPQYRINNSFTAEGRGCSVKNCDNSSQREKDEQQQAQVFTNTSSISIISKKANLIQLASSRKIDCSSILADHDSNNNTNNNSSNDTCRQTISMPKQGNPPMQTRKLLVTAASAPAAGVKCVSENNSLYRTNTNKLFDNNNKRIDFSINRDCATSNGSEFSDADTNIDTTTLNSVPLLNEPTTIFTGFSEYSNADGRAHFEGATNLLSRNESLTSAECSYQNNSDSLKETTINKLTSTEGLQEQSAAATTTRDLEEGNNNAGGLNNAGGSSKCCLARRSHESSNNYPQIGQLRRNHRHQNRQQEREEATSSSSSSKILQMSLRSSLDHATSSSFPATEARKTTKTVKNSSNLNLNLDLNLNFNDSLNSNLTPGKRIWQQNEEKASNHLVNLAQNFPQRHVFKRKQQRVGGLQLQQQVVADSLSLSRGSRGNSNSKVIKLNLPIETKTCNKNNSNSCDISNNKSLLFNIDEERDEEVIEVGREQSKVKGRESETGKVSNHSSVIISKAIKVDSNLHLNSNLSSCSIIIDNNNNKNNDDEKGSTKSKRKNRFKEEDIICTRSSRNILNDKQQANVCFLPPPTKDTKPIKIVDERGRGKKEAAQDETNDEQHQQQVVTSSLTTKEKIKKEKKKGKNSKEKNEENLLINTFAESNNKRRKRLNLIKTNTDYSNNSRIRSSYENNYTKIETNNNSSSGSFECDKIGNNIKLIETNKDRTEEKEVAAFESKRKRAWRVEVTQCATNSSKAAAADCNDADDGDDDDDYGRINNKLLLDWKFVKRRKKSYRGNSLFIWFSMILFGCLLLSFDSNNNDDDDDGYTLSGWSASVGLVSPLGRVSGQSTSDEFSRAVLATMTTQSPPPSILNNNNNSSIGQYGSTPLPDEVDSYLTSDLQQNNQSPRHNNNNNQFDQLDHEQTTSSSVIDKFLDFGRIFIIGAIIIGDICGNSLVILSVCRHSKLRVTTNWFVVSLACADILVALFAMTFNASVIISGRWLFKPWVCDFWNSCDVLASTASILHLCCISIDRYIAITRPLDYPMKITTRRVIYALCGVWISSALLSYLPIFTGVYTTAEHIKWLKDNPEQCDFVVNRVYAIVSSSISFWIPSSIMVFTYYRIYKEATRQEKFMYKQQIMPAPMANHHHHRERDHHHNDSSGGNHLNKSTNRAKQRRSKSMAVSTSSNSNTFSSNEARIRQLAKQQQELQPTSGLLNTTTTTATATTRLGSTSTTSTNQRQTNSFNSVATTNLNSISSIPESTAQQTNQGDLTTNKASSNLDPGATATTERASSLLQLSATNTSPALPESQPLTAPTTTTTSLNVVPNNNNLGDATTENSRQLVQGVQGKKQPANVAFDEGKEGRTGGDGSGDDDDDLDDDDDQDSNSGQSTPTKRSISKMKREHKAAKTLGIIMGVFILCWLPFFSWYTPQHICGHACDGMVPRGAVTILFWIGYFNSTLNPIIYAYFNHEFRDAFKKTLQWLFCCCNDLKCLRVNRPNDNQHYNCTYRSTQEIGLVTNS